MSVHRIPISRVVYDSRAGMMITVRCTLIIDTDKISPRMVHKARSNKSGQSKLGPLTLRLENHK